jgi:late competence protein required for DNA uptake (superfamily II DNA/RNA helicase)
MAPKGKTPSLIGSGAGSSKIVTALKKRTCKRCKGTIPRGTKCLEVSIPGSFGSKTYCRQCYVLILQQTSTDLAELTADVNAM